MNIWWCTKWSGKRWNERKQNYHTIVWKADKTIRVIILFIRVTTSHISKLECKENRGIRRIIWNRFYYVSFLFILFYISQTMASNVISFHFIPFYSICFCQSKHSAQFSKLQWENKKEIKSINTFKFMQQDK